jgi:hypothetical protein
VYYGGGGGGSGSTNGAGGAGGGGAGGSGSPLNGTDGTANTGGGGGGGFTTFGGNGGSGVVIVKFKTSEATVQAASVSRVIKATDSIRVYQTVSPAETVASLPLTTGGPYNYVVVYTMKLPSNVPSGSLIEITTDGEITNNNSYNLMVAGYICVGTSPSDYSGTTIYPANGNDIIDSGHNHSRMNRTISFVTSTDISNKYVNVVWYSASTSASPGDIATVMAGYGFLNVVIR